MCCGQMVGSPSVAPIWRGDDRAESESELSPNLSPILRQKFSQAWNRA